MSEPQRREHALMSVGYLLGAMLVVIPAVETAIYALPFTPSAVRWRFGLIGYVGQGLALPTTGVVVLVVTAFLRGRMRTLRALSVLCFLAAMSLVVASVILLLDAVQIRREVDPAMHQNYDAATLKALASMAFAFAVNGWLAVTGWVASRRPEREEGRGAEPTIVARAGKV